MTKFRAGLVLGLTTGYYLGARAGRPRYDQIRTALDRLRGSRALDEAATAVGRAKAVVDLGRERVHDAVEHADPRPELRVDVAVAHRAASNPWAADRELAPAGAHYVAR